MTMLAIIGHEWQEVWGAAVAAAAIAVATLQCRNNDDEPSRWMLMSVNYAAICLQLVRW